jgi:hypothetical protein
MLATSLYRLVLRGEGPLALGAPAVPAVWCKVKVKFRAVLKLDHHLLRADTLAFATGCDEISFERWNSTSLQGSPRWSNGSQLRRPYS